jgi:quinol monooxygenase YgiN
MGEFLKTVPPLMSTGLDLTHYSVSSGFLDKSGTCAEAALIYDTRITCASSGARASLLAKLKAVAEAEERDAEGTMTFFVLESLDDETGVRVMERYGSKAALEEHLQSQRMREFWLGAKEEIKSLEARWYVPNGKGWLHH